MRGHSHKCFHDKVWETLIHNLLPWSTESPHIVQKFTKLHLFYKTEECNPNDIAFSFGVLKDEKLRIFKNVIFFLLVSTITTLKNLKIGQFMHG